MTPTDLRVAVQRLWPRRVRTRLAVFYAVLFLMVGVVLFMVGFYILMHRDAIQRWIASFERTWHAWR